jgi:hypothetical protein
VFNIVTSKHEMTIVFEVCKISRMEITGVKLKRVKGDTWQYKKVSMVVYVPCSCLSFAKSFFTTRSFNFSVFLVEV